MDSPRRPMSRTASIPSRHRGQGDLRSSLVVRKLDGMTSSMNNSTSSFNRMMSSNSAGLSKFNSSRLRNDLRRHLHTMEYDQRSLEVLVRLLKAGPFIHDVINDENTRPPQTPPLTPAPSLEDLDVHSSDAEEPKYVSTYVIRKPKKSNKTRFGDRPMTSDVTSDFRKSIDELKEARERFGVCMSVNETIARVRTLQQKNEKSRRKANKDRLPNLNSSSSGESLDGEKSPRHCCVIERSDTWLSLSGQKIKLKHQGHVEKALDSDVRNPIITQGRRAQRIIRSAPPIKSKPINAGRTWGEDYRHSNRFIIKKVNRSLQNNKNLINFSASFHGFETTQAKPDVTLGHQLPLETVRVASSRFATDFHRGAAGLPLPTNDVTAVIKNVVSMDTLSVPSSRHNYVTMSDSTSSSPHGVRSIVIKLPNSNTITSSQNPSQIVTSSGIISSTPDKPQRKLEISPA